MKALQDAMTTDHEFLFQLSIAVTLGMGVFFVRHSTRRIRHDIKAAEPAARRWTGAAPTTRSSPNATRSASARSGCLRPASA